MVKAGSSPEKQKAISVARDIKQPKSRKSSRGASSAVNTKASQQNLETEVTEVCEALKTVAIGAKGKQPANTLGNDVKLVIKKHRPLAHRYESQNPCPGRCSNSSGKFTEPASRHLGGSAHLGLSFAGSCGVGPGPIQLWSQSTPSAAVAMKTRRRWRADTTHARAPSTSGVTACLIVWKACFRLSWYNLPRAVSSYLRPVSSSNGTLDSAPGAQKIALEVPRMQVKYCCAVSSILLVSSRRFCTDVTRTGARILRSRES